MSPSTPLVGILAVQGGVAEHERTLKNLGVNYRLVRRREHLEGLDGLIFPGGESTTMSKLLVNSGMVEPIRDLLDGGLPAFGTCAGMILLAKTVLDTRADAISFGAIDMTVRRNAFGRQQESFEAHIDITGLDHPVEAVFIRAPWVEEVSNKVEVIGRVTGAKGDNVIVAVRQGRVMATSFHPEVTSDGSIHRLFLDTCVSVPAGTGE